MSRFYASIQGNRGELTRQGHKYITGHVRGWNVGIRVTGLADSNDQDEFVVYLTSGSGGGKSDKLIGRFTRQDLEEVTE